MCTPEGVPPGPLCTRLGRFVELCARFSVHNTGVRELCTPRLGDLPRCAPKSARIAGCAPGFECTTRGGASCAPESRCTTARRRRFGCTMRPFGAGAGAQRKRHRIVHPPPGALFEVCRIRVHNRLRRRARQCTFPAWRKVDSSPYSPAPSPDLGAAAWWQPRDQATTPSLTARGSLV